MCYDFFFVLSNEHIEVMEKFWSFTVCKTGKRKINKINFNKFIWFIGKKK